MLGVNMNICGGIVLPTERGIPVIPMLPKRKLRLIEGK